MEIENINALLKVAVDWVGGQPVTALYPCCGQDTKPFTFTHPDFFNHLGLANTPGPNIFIFIDKEEHKLEYNDANLTIEVAGEETGSILGSNAVFQKIVWISSSGEEWLVQRKRNLFVAYLVGDWRRFPVVFKREGFVPDFFIGVTDGCRMGGGNPECVNRLSTSGLTYEEAERVEIPRYYITDHFENATIPDPCPKGASVRSNDAEFPYVFRKLSLLSSEWGNYGYHTTLGGATLFEAISS